MDSYVMKVFKWYLRQKYGLYNVAIEAMESPHCPLYGSVEETLAEIDKLAEQLCLFRREIERYREAARGLNLVEANRLLAGLTWMLKKTFIWHRFTPRAMIEIGKLTPDLRWAAVSKYTLELEECNLQQIDAADLDWNAVRMAEHAREKGIISLYFALADPDVLKRIASCIYVLDDLSEYITPQYQKVPYPIARRIAMGESPVSLTGGVLTRKEAHQWCLDGAPKDVAGWLAGRLGVPYHRSAKVVRWLAHCRKSGRWDALNRLRRMRIDGQREVRVCSLLQILDEVQSEDIVTGRDSVDAVMRRIATRLSEAWRRREMHNYKPLAPTPKWAETLPRGIRLLNTPAALVREGQEMRHCVGSYIPAVRDGECHIISITTRQGRSTAELSPDLRIVQHKGPHNSNPPARNVRLLNALIKRIKRGNHAHLQRAA